MAGSVQVGSRYSADSLEWAEGSEYSYRSSGHQLLLFERSPTAEEIAEIAYEQADFALRVYRHVIFLMYRFGRQPWNSAPYSWHLVPYPERSLPIASRDLVVGQPLRVVLVDAADGIVRAIRDLEFSLEFGGALNDEIRKQASRRFPGNRDYDRSVQDIDDLWPHTSTVCEESIARCIAGE